MATLLPQNVPLPHLLNTVAVDIENRYERIVNVVRERKRTLLTRLSEFREEYDTLLSNTDKTEQELKSTKEHIERIKENDLKKMQEKFLTEIEENLRKLRRFTASFSIKFNCESRELESKLSTLGELFKLDYKLPNYSEMVTPVVAVGKKGKGKDEFHEPNGIAFNEETQLIYVCDEKNSRVKVVSMTGEFISQFGNNELDWPWGILLYQDGIYVTDWKQCAIFLFNQNTHQLIKKLGKKGSGKCEFNQPRSLAIGPDGDLYVVDHNRISVLDVCLNFKRFIQHKMIISPVDVQFTDNNMFILCFNSPHRVHLLTLQGKYLKSIISIESSSTWFFCLDRANNILVSISGENLVQVYNEEGELLHTIGKGQLDYPLGLTTTRSGRLIVVSNPKNFGLQIF